MRGGGVVAEGVGAEGGREVVAAAPGDVDVGRRGSAVCEAEEGVVVEGRGGRGGSRRVEGGRHGRAMGSGSGRPWLHGGARGGGSTASGTPPGRRRRGLPLVARPAVHGAVVLGLVRGDGRRRPAPSPRAKASKKLGEGEEDDEVGDGWERQGQDWIRRGRGRGGGGGGEEMGTRVRWGEGSELGFGLQVGLFFLFFSVDTSMDGCEMVR